MDVKNSVLNESIVSDGEGKYAPISLDLLSAVCDIEVLNSELVKALDAHDPERVKAILDRGANPNYRPEGRTDTLLMTACYDNDTDSVLNLLAAGADPNEVTVGEDAKIITPLMIAAENGMTEAVAELLLHNADPHVRTAMGETALLAAARSNNHDAFAVLVGSMVRGSTPPIENQII